MKNSLFLFAFLLMLSTYSFAQETNKTLVRSIDPQGTSIIDLDFKKHGVEASPWDQGTIRIELEITANFPEAVVAQLVKAGRYTLTTKVENGVLKVTAENLEKAVTVGGKDLEDQVRVYARTPGYYAVEDGQIKKSFDMDAVAGVLDRAGSKEEAKEMLKKMSVIKEEVNVTYRFVYKEKGDAGREIAPEASFVTPSTNEKTGPVPALKDVQARYGDILISSEPIEFEFD